MASLDQHAICGVFNAAFGADHGVRLVGGGREPAYTPPAPGRCGELLCREDFAASALHEAAHWCCADRGMRAQDDYGCVYVPPPRGVAGQTRFFAMEQRVQAYECWFAAAAGIEFNASADDPDWALVDVRCFEARVRAHAAAFAWRPSLAAARARCFVARLASARAAL
ncbi:MAG: elongation factor P hydroxylase [Pseudomonadota bacterium]